MLPVVIILYDPQAGVLYWQHVETGQVRLTGGEGKLLIPRSQVLDSAGAGRDRLRQIVRDFRQADPLADSLPLLPPSAAGVLRATTGWPEDTTMLVFQLASGRHQPELTAASLLAGQPSWLSGGGGQFEAAIGAYANDHGHRDVARRAFELAAAYDRPHRGRLLSIAALLAVAGEDLEGAEADLARIPDPDGLFPRLGRAAIADHARPDGDPEGGEMNQLLREADPADLAGEPTLLSVLAGGLAVRAIPVRYVGLTFRQLPVRTTDLRQRGVPAATLDRRNLKDWWSCSRQLATGPRLLYSLSARTPTAACSK